ncbi:hypothetical protein F2P56_033026 [Juglans regia]|uniref:Uncharacterized protein LOC108998930 n=2 Tax=Juglans regia TaxID=51240 RepID=A0A2I4FHX7_JUGRE|nr:uncharacterized protein LOC108998930 [Juglans regia]KAF5447472.1 hypothetical protein F2P56_033026 [Juglans regia]
MGATERPYSMMEVFRSAMVDSKLNEVPFEGDYFTWSNRREGLHFTKEKLDRALGNLSWFSLFPDYYVSTLSAYCSNHCPILLTTGAGLTTGMRNQRPFRYEANWDSREECGDLIKKAWDNISHQRSQETSESLLRCKELLQQWSKSNF